MSKFQKNSKVVPAEKIVVDTTTEPVISPELPQRETSVACGRSNEKPPGTYPMGGVGASRGSSEQAIGSIDDPNSCRDVHKARSPGDDTVIVKCVRSTADACIEVDSAAKKRVLIAPTKADREEIKTWLSKRNLWAKRVNAVPTTPKGEHRGLFELRMPKHHARVLLGMHRKRFLKFIGVTESEVSLSIVLSVGGSCGDGYLVI